MTQRFHLDETLRGLVVLLLIAAVLAPRSVETARTFSAWSAPVSLVALNSPEDDILPHISKNGLSLYFASNRPGGFGDFDIYVSERPTIDAAWGPPVNLGATINTSFNDRAPGLSRDSHYLFYASSRPGGFGMLDIWVSYRTDTHDDFGWEPAVNLGPGINSAANDFGPDFLANDEAGIPMLFFGSNRPGVGGFDIYVSHLLANGSFGPAALIAELSTSFNDFRPTVRPDGLELFFDSNRPAPEGVPGLGLRDLWTSTRGSISEPWSPPTNLGPAINSELNEGFPALSSDGRSLIFSSDRLGAGMDLYECSRGKP